MLQELKGYPVTNPPSPGLVPMGCDFVGEAEAGLRSCSEVHPGEAEFQSNSAVKIFPVSTHKPEKPEVTTAS